jgi:menaquinone-dependent protoporphyrinogen oxidase
VRYLMKRIARSQNAPTGTSRDYEFTDWTAVDRFVQEMAEVTSVSPLVPSARP